MMAIVNTFLCNCGRTIGRPGNVAPGKDDPPRYGGVAWHARSQDAPMKAIRCGDCKQWWTFTKPKVHKAYADVKKCCTTWRCEC